MKFREASFRVHLLVIILSVVGVRCAGFLEFQNLLLKDQPRRRFFNSSAFCFAPIGFNGARQGPTSRPTSKLHYQYLSSATKLNAPPLLLAESGQNTLAVFKGHSSRGEVRRSMHSSVAQCHAAASLSGLSTVLRMRGGGWFSSSTVNEQGSSNSDNRAAGRSARDDSGDDRAGLGGVDKLSWWERNR